MLQVKQNITTEGGAPRCTQWGMDTNIGIRPLETSRTKGSTQTPQVGLDYELAVLELGAEAAKHESRSANE